MNDRRWAWIILALGLLLPSTARAGFTQIVSFGDSLSDVGNTFAAGGTPPAPYYQGHYSNGSIWLEYLAPRLGLAVPTASQLGGNDYSWGGAETGTGFSPQGGVPNVETQVATYLSGHTPTAGQLFTIMAGGNDFFDGQTDPSVGVKNIADAVTSLAKAGGKTFLVSDLPELGLVPASLGLPQAQRDALNALSSAFNAQLSARLDQLQASLGITIDRLGLNGTLLAIQANPGAYGFTNATEGSLNNGDTSGAGYLFWDDVHPTTAGQKIISDIAFAAVTVPEPNSLALCGIGAVIGLGVARVRRRRAA